MQPSSVGLIAALAVEPPSVGMMATSTVTVTSTLFLVPNSLLSFNLEENGFMKILRPSWRLNAISTRDKEKKWDIILHQSRFTLDYMKNHVQSIQKDSDAYQYVV